MKNYDQASGFYYVYDKYVFLKRYVSDSSPYYHIFLRSNILTNEIFVYYKTTE